MDKKEIIKEAIMNKMKSKDFKDKVMARIKERIKKEIIDKRNGNGD